MKRSRHQFQKLVFLAIVGSVAAVAVAAATAPTAKAGGANAAVAINTQDGKSVFRVRLSVTRENGDVVDAGNAAVAYASCSDCTTTAIAFQAVLITSDASVIQPTNIAIAINEGCTNCQTLADAYQYVLSTGGQVHFTADGNQTLASIRHDLQELRTRDLSVEELQAQLDKLSAAFADVLAHEVVVVGN